MYKMVLYFLCKLNNLQEKGGSKLIEGRELMTKDGWKAMFNYSYSPKISFSPCKFIYFEKINFLEIRFFF
jgi:hypothetical protein